ncbi:Hypothetical protein FKW44_021891 [Caligus rogercresseyi]|uniref:Uncharacterized protein n=1 Tax=Caligus rogercresseyi TaxID=217165 RepID=A0A7T8JWR1_CALRO|nr:Hypothetical protein FKW44_021891 [Caligus rogercresseyi]
MLGSWFTLSRASATEDSRRVHQFTVLIWEWYLLRLLVQFYHGVSSVNLGMKNFLVFSFLYFIFQF